MFGKSAVFAAALVAGVLVAGGGALAYHPTDSAPNNHRLQDITLNKLYAAVSNQYACNHA